MNWRMMVLVLLLMAAMTVSCGRRGAPRMQESNVVNSVNQPGQDEPVVEKGNTRPSDVESVVK
jgi:hypothetical protein